MIRASDPLAAWHVSETPCGLIAAFAREADAEKLLQRGDLARVFQGPVQVYSIIPQTDLTGHIRRVASQLFASSDPMHCKS